MADRATTKGEDMYYSLLGIFEVVMPVIYGEGAENARRRLLAQIAEANQQVDEFSKIADWLSPPDPWVNHNAARRRCEPHTGSWLLQSDQYQRWRRDRYKHFWLHGKAGCGKTVLFSTAIEDIRSQCETRTNVAFALFYFTFSDERKQSYQSLLLSLVTQLGWREPAQSALRRLYNTANRRLPGPETLEEILLSSVKQHDEVFLLLDALDECPEDDEARQNVLDCLHRLTQGANNVKIFATSRQLLEIKASMENLGANSVSIDTGAVDADIGRYVRGELSRDRKLKGLPEHTLTMILETLAQKADGM
jgi:hypothetical protein